MNRDEERQIFERMEQLERAIIGIKAKLDQLALSTAAEEAPQIAVPIEPEPSEVQAETISAPVESAPATEPVDPPPAVLQPEPETSRLPALSVSPEHRLSQPTQSESAPESNYSDASHQQADVKPLIPAEFIDKFLKSEFLLNKLGIGLLLFGVIFLFKYSIDQGWITPPIRAAFGLLIGGVLLNFGLRLYDKRAHFSLVLLGGAIATFYITIFSAFQMYQLISHPVAFGLMCAITILSLVLALNKEDMILSLIGMIGGLGTPFFLYTGEGNLPGLITYACILVYGSLGIFFFKLWRPLLVVTVIGGWLIMGIALGNLTFASNPPPLHVLTAQIGIIICFLGFWLTPVIRETLAVVHPDKWGLPSTTGEEQPPTIHPQAHLSAISAPLVGLTLSIATLDLLDIIGQTGWGIVSMILALMYAFVSYKLQRWSSVNKLAYTHAVVSALLFTLGLTFLLDGSVLLITIATEAAVLHFVAKHLKDRRTEIGAHLLFSAVVLALAYRLIVPQDTASIFSMSSISDLWVIGMFGVTAWRFGSTQQRSIYALLASAGLAGWLLRGLEGDFLLAMLATEATAIHFLAHRIKDETLTVGGHVLFAITLVWLGTNLVSNLSRYELLAPSSASVLWIAGLLGTTAWRFGANEIRSAYTLLAFAVLAGWFIRVLEPEILLATLATEALAIIVLARRIKDDLVGRGGDALFALTSLWLLAHLSNHGLDNGLFSRGGLSALWVVAALSVNAWRFADGVRRTGYILTANALFAVWLMSGLRADTEFLALTAQAFLLHYMAFKLKDSPLRFAAHFFFAALAFALASRLVGIEARYPALINYQAVVEIALIVGGVAAGKLFLDQVERRIYFLAAHFAVLALILRECISLENGQGIVSAIWAAYSIALLIAGLRLNNNDVRKLAMATLLVVTVKLFIVDLAKLETIWKILLFIGLGGLLLALSYYFQSLWKEGDLKQITPSDNDSTGERP